MKHPEALIEQFCLATSQHAAATECGDYKRGNKAYKQITEALQQLAAQQATQLLCPLLDSSDIGTRSWAATYLLTQGEPAAEIILQEIADQSGIHSLEANITLREWRAGRLQLLF